MYFHCPQQESRLDFRAMKKPSRQLFAVPPSQAGITRGFWKERLAVNRTAIIPVEYKQCKETGRLDAWTWKPGEPNEPHIFWDSDVAKWIEAVAYAHYEAPDPVAEAQVDAYIDAMENAQAPDGYCNSHFLRVEPENRWTNLRDQHELYCAGHLIEAAVAYFQATGKQKLLDIMLRYVDHIAKVFGTGDGQLRGIPGHQEIELALIRLYHLTRDPKHLALAQYFVHQRGQSPHYWDVEAATRTELGLPPASYPFTPQYAQSDKPARQLAAVTGHSVRAVYFYSAMADIAAECGDVALLHACHRLWDDLTQRNLYITGGIGSSRHNEGFTAPYDLPNETAYSETCAAIGLVFWARRMAAIEPHRRYTDLIETALYNAILGGVSLDGKKFFYDNPLASTGSHHRREWFGCACCPPNIARFLAALPQYIADTSAHGFWIHQYISSTVSAALNGIATTLDQTTDYPWDPRVTLAVTPRQPSTFTLHLRIPAWATGATLLLNGQPLDCTPQPNGYAALTREWRAGDTLVLELPLKPRYVFARPEVFHNAGRAALMRGPLVYCLEQADSGDALASVLLPPPDAWEEIPGTGIFNGTTLLATRGATAALPRPDNAPLYCGTPYPVATRPVTAIPYAFWDNRAPGEMRVWLRHPRAT